MSFPDADQVAARIPFVAESETVAAAAFALTPGETDLTAGACSVLSPPVGGEGPTEVDCSLLEHLRGDLVPPGKPRRLLGDSPIRGDDEQPAGILAPLPGVEGVDEVVPGPWNPYRRVHPSCGECIDDELEALVVREPRSACVLGEQLLLGRGWIQGEPERRMPHLVCKLLPGRDISLAIVPNPLAR
jgi:hypothetical protein